MLIGITVFRNNQTKISLVAAIVAFTCTEAFHKLGAGTTDQCTPFLDFQVHSATGTRNSAAWGLQVARDFSQAGLTRGLKEQARPGFQSLLRHSQAGTTLDKLSLHLFTYKLS